MDFKKSTHCLIQKRVYNVYVLGNGKHKDII